MFQKKLEKMFFYVRILFSNIFEKYWIFVEIFRKFPVIFVTHRSCTMNGVAHSQGEVWELASGAGLALRDHIREFKYFWAPPDP